MKQKSKQKLKEKENQKPYTPADVARDFFDDMVWESEHFGHATIPCARDGRSPCKAIFYYAGSLSLMCVNDECGHQGHCLILEEILQEIADYWNKPKETVRTVATYTKDAVTASYFFTESPEANN